MTVDPNGPNTREEQLQEALAAYFEGAEQGTGLCRRQLLDRHPELAAELTDFFCIQDQLHRLAEPLRPQASSGSDSRSGTVELEPDPLAALFAVAVASSPASEGYRDLRDYEVLGEIARGGMGVVYRARQRSLNRLVALKVIRDGVSATEDDRRRFRNEAEAVANLDHPHIVPIYEVGDHRGCRFFSMKLVDGGNLGERLSEFSADARGAARLMVMVARAVHHAHERGILHRDLKPSNILIDDQGRALVADFGLVRRVVGDSSLTQTGAVLGTPSYMAPEQATGRKGDVTTATDVHGLGSILYALLTGKPPFRGGSPLETLDRVREQPPEPPSALRSATDRDLETICLKCLEKDPRGRYASAEAMALDLERWLAGKSILARPAGRADRAWRWCRRHPVPMALLLIMALLTSLTATGLILVMRASQTIGHLNDGLLARELVLKRHHYAADLKQAYYLIGTNQVGEALDLLSRHRPEPDGTDVRGFEWYFLWRLCHVGRPALGGHTGEVYHAEFSPDGRTLASCGSDKTIRLWDLATRQQRLVLRGHEGEINFVAFSPDGRTLATAGDDQTIRLWDVVRGVPGSKLTGQNDEVVGVAFLPDGKRLASCGRNGVVIIWDLLTGGKLAEIQVPNARIHSIAISPDGSTLAVSGEGVGLWDLTTRRHIFWLSGTVNTVYRVVFSHDGQTVAAAGRERTVRLWDVRTGRLKAAIQGHGADVESVTFSPDDRTIASVDDDGMIYFWDVVSGAAGKIASRQGRLWCAEFSRDGQTLVTTSADGSVKIWDCLLDRDRIALRLPSPVVHSISFSTDSTNLLVVGEFGALWSWNATDGKWRSTQRLAAGNATYRYLLARDGRTLATADFEGRIRLRQVEDGLRTASTTVDSKKASFMAIAPAGNAIAILHDGTVTYWDTTSGRMSSRSNCPALTAAFPPHGPVLALAGWTERGPSVWDVPTGAYRLAKGPGHQGTIRALEFFPNGKTLATGADDKTIKIWNVETLAPRFTLLGHTAGITTLAIAPFGETLASMDHDHTVKLWRDGSPEAILTFDVYPGDDERMCFSPDGRALATCARSSAKEHQVFLWAAPREGEAPSEPAPRLKASQRIFGNPR